MCMKVGIWVGAEVELGVGEGMGGVGLARGVGAFTACEWKGDTRYIPRRDYIAGSYGNKHEEREHQTRSCRMLNVYKGHAIHIAVPEVSSSYATARWIPPKQRVHN